MSKSSLYPNLNSLYGPRSGELIDKVWELKQNKSPKAVKKLINELFETGILTGEQTLDNLKYKHFLYCLYNMFGYLDPKLPVEPHSVYRERYNELYRNYYRCNRRIEEAKIQIKYISSYTTRDIFNFTEVINNTMAKLTDEYNIAKDKYETFINDNLIFLESECLNCYYYYSTIDRKLDMSFNIVNKHMSRTDIKQGLTDNCRGRDIYCLLCDKKEYVCCTCYECTHGF